MKTVHNHKGLTVTLPGPPQIIDTQDAPATHVAWQPPENIELNPESLVTINQPVRAGEPLFIDKNTPMIRHVAPASGHVSEILRDSDNRLTHVVIEPSEATPQPFGVGKELHTHTGIRSLLLESGLWTQIRQRPFDTIPPINSQPNNIVVSAIDTRPSAPDPRVVIQRRQAEFDMGLETLLTQTNGALWVCQAPGDAITSTSFEKLKNVCFTGIHPAGMPSLHIQTLCAASLTSTVWRLDYQDVIALGYLLLRGEPSSENIICLSGDQVRNPRLINTNVGANISELLAKELIDNSDSHRPIVGSYLSGRTKPWLGRFDHQITVMGNTGFNSSRTTDANPPVSGFVPDPVFDRVNAFNILPVPLLRALAADDVALAEALGCMELCPEDLDIFNYVCVEGNNYSDLLENCLQQLSVQYVSQGNTQDAI